MNTNQAKKQERIVITGIGMYSPIGKNKNEVYDSLIHSRDGFKQVNEFDVSNLRNDRGGVIKDIEKIDTVNGLRSNILLQHAVNEAIEDASLSTFKELDRSRVGVSIGTSVGGYGGFVDKLYEENEEETTDMPGLNPHNSLDKGESVLNLSLVLLSYEIAKKHNFTGFITSSVTACSAGANAIAMARDYILTDHVDMMIVGGVDPISQLTYLGFNALMALTKDTIRPMDTNRSGLLIGEGAASLVLEKESSAVKRGAKIYGVLSGCGITNDAHHCTQPHPEAKGATLAIQRALADACLEATQIDYVNLHGTGTKHNDLMEIKALNNIFGEDFDIPISSTKSMMGHTLGAAGAIEAAICLLSLDKKIIPPNLNHKERIEGYNYDVVGKTRKNMEIKNILSNSFGFGGNCAALIFSEYSA